MLGALRKNSKHWLVMTLVAVGVFGMAFFFGSSNESGSIPTWAAKVQGETISFKTLNNIYASQVERIKTQYPEIDAKMLENLNYKEKILSDLILNKLVSNNAKSIAYLVSDSELKEHIVNNTMFHKDGKFNIDYYKGFLAYSGYSTSDFENAYRSDILNAKLRETILSSVVISDKEYELAYLLENEKISISFVEYIFDEKDIKISNSDIASFLESEEGGSKVKNYYVENNEKYKEKETVRARHILSKVEQDYSIEQRLEKRKKLEELLSIIDLNNFSDLAMLHSDDGSKANGGDLNYFTRGQMVKPFEDVAFSLRIGEISNIVETEFGYHIILLDDKKPERIISFEEVKTDIAKNILKDLEKEKRKNSEINNILSKNNLKQALQSVGKYEVSELFSRSANNIDKLPGLSSNVIQEFFNLELNKLYHKNIANKDYILYVKEFIKADFDDKAFSEFKNTYLDRIRNDFFTKYTENLRTKFANKIKYSKFINNPNKNNESLL